MENNLWIALINAIKDIVVAIIKAVKRKGTTVPPENPQDPEPTKKIPEPIEKVSNSPYIPNEDEIRNLSIKDEHYLPKMGTYLFTDRAPTDIMITDKEEE